MAAINAQYRSDIMNLVKKSLIATAFLVSTAVPAAAITSSDVLDAMNARVGELSQQINELQLQIASATNPADRAFFTRQSRVLFVRRGQLISLSRIVPRYNERFLTRIVTFFDLDVSLA